MNLHELLDLVIDAENPQLHKAHLHNFLRALVDELTGRKATDATQAAADHFVADAGAALGLASHPTA